MFARISLTFRWRASVVLPTCLLRPTYSEGRCNSWREIKALLVPRGGLAEPWDFNHLYCQTRLTAFIGIKSVFEMLANPDTKAYRAAQWVARGPLPFALESFAAIAGAHWHWSDLRPIATMPLTIAKCHQQTFGCVSYRRGCVIVGFHSRASFCASVI